MKPAEHAPISFTRMVDRIYEDTSADCIVHGRDAETADRLIRKTNSDTTVVWNPWELPMARTTRSGMSLWRWRRAILQRIPSR